MTLSQAGLQAVLAQETDECFLELLTIDHADMADPIQIVNDRQDLYRSGANYWSLRSGVNGWSGTNATLTAGTGFVTLEATAADPQMISPASLTILGATNPIIRAKVRRRAAGAWEGRAFFSTSGHGFTSGYYKDITDTTVLNQWVTLEWDMSALTVGGTDWTDSTITRLRLDLSSADASEFDVEWISVGDYYYVAFPFRAQLQPKTEDRVAEAQIVCDNVDQRIIYALRGLSDGATAQYQVVLADDPGEVEYGPFEFEVMGFAADAQTITLRVSGDYRVLNEAFPKDYFAPWNAG
jgi:hypothetical protein